MPVVIIRVQTKSQGRYTENWDIANQKISIDSIKPEQFFKNWKEWFADNPSSELGGVRGEFYSFNTEEGTLELFHDETILNLKKQPRILNDDSRQAPEQTQAPSNVAGQEVSALSTHAISAPFGAELENDF